MGIRNMRTEKEILEKIKNLESNRRLFLVGTTEWYTINSEIGGLNWVLAK